jgi:hypothetical protein
MNDPHNATDLLIRRPPETTLAWACQAYDPRAQIETVTFLPGGVSHANHVLHLVVDGKSVAVILRRWVRTEWQQIDPEFSPAHEIATYELLATSEVPSPRLIAAAPKGVAGDVPALLLTKTPGQRLTGATEIKPFLVELAAVLPKIHAVDLTRAAGPMPPYRPYYERGQLTIPAWTRQPALWARAIEIGTGPAPDEEEVFIHRDYHPGNTLWLSVEDRVRLSAVVDWTTAERGPRAVDLAHLRTNLLLSYNYQTAAQFLKVYLKNFAPTGYFYHPYWDLRDTLDFLPEIKPSLAQVARLETFVSFALSQL